MELTYDQVTAIKESLQKLTALGNAVGHICEAGVPIDDVMCGWQLLLWGIADEISQIIDPKTAKKETA
jgi:hypothetical protein